MRKYTPSELAQLYDKKDWATLWKIIQPMVKHEIRCCVRRGELNVQYARDEDLLQEAALAAWKCLPRWNAFESGLRRWVGQSVRGAVRNTAQRAASGIVGGRDSGVSITGLPEEEDREGDEEDTSVPRLVTYAETPDGLLVPGTDSEPEELLALVPARDRDMIRRLCGIGVPAQTQEEYAALAGLHRDTLTRRIRGLRKTFSAKSQKPVIDTVGHRKTRG